MLKSYVNDQKEVTVDAGRSIHDTLKAIGIDPDLVAGVFVNDDQESKAYIVKEGDIVRVLAVIGGG